MMTVRERAVKQNQTTCNHCHQLIFILNQFFSLLQINYQHLAIQMMKNMMGYSFHLYLGELFAVWLVLLGCDCYQIEINSNIIQVGDWDYRGNRCIGMLDRALEFQASKVQFIPTQYQADSNKDGTIDYYCHKASKGNCPAFDQQWIDLFREDMQRCFQYAIDKGLSISLSPHLDDGLETGVWRNTLRLDPLVPYGGYSYAEIMLYPLADALKATANANTQIWFGMQGEMGATVMYNPQSYITLFQIIRDRMLLDSNIQPQNLKIGLGLNFNKLCACVLLDLVDPTLYLDQFPAAIAPILNTFDLEGIKQLFFTTDFMAVSNYASLTPNFATPELQSAIYQFDEELKVFGVSIRDLVRNNGKEIYFAEYGVGGGVKISGAARATTQEEVAKFPFFGISGPYSRATDPWQMYSDVISPARQYMHYFYEKTIEMASSDINVNYDIGNEFYRTEFVYDIGAIYIWNLVSWDVQAVYPYSTNSQGSYRDEYVVGLIKNHNANY
eukprot:TRINITY_DN2065_c0_g1_i6.p1 TRINITY_DN2065_c0_g1~~TRINITY_DN2065_c0_g1_i6.p1  ORF type:complete len:499 (+),score=61.21 TRINITY_DN2065_c0_g1_i6:25-1521(+)